MGKSALSLTSIIFACEVGSLSGFCGLVYFCLVGGSFWVALGIFAAPPFPSATVRAPYIVFPFPHCAYPDCACLHPFPYWNFIARATPSLGRFSPNPLRFKPNPGRLARNPIWFSPESGRFYAKVWPVFRHSGAGGICPCFL